MKTSPMAKSKLEQIRALTGDAQKAHAVVAWTAEEILEVAAIYGHRWAPDEAREFLLAHESQLENVMLAAACAYLDQLLSPQPEE